MRHQKAGKWSPLLQAQTWIQPTRTRPQSGRLSGNEEPIDRLRVRTDSIPARRPWLGGLHLPCIARVPLSKGAYRRIWRQKRAWNVRAPSSDVFVGFPATLPSCARADSYYGIPWPCPTSAAIVAVKLTHDPFAPGPALPSKPKTTSNKTVPPGAIDTVPSWITV